MTSIPTYLPADGDGELTVRGFGFAYPEVTASGDIGGVRRTSAPFTLDTTTDGSKTVRIGAIEGTVSGVVTTTAGDPVAGTLVAAYLDTDGWLPSVTATTEADGRYTISGPPGAYRLVFLPPAGQGFAATWHQGQLNRFAVTPTVIAAAGAVLGVDQVLPTD